MIFSSTEFVFLSPMCFILHIETATEVCSASLARNGKIIAVKETSEEKSHARTLSVFVDELIKSTDMKNKPLDAVAVSMGPGSYTGLRIGVSVAKGLCYGFNIPLISVPTLEAMSKGFQDKLKTSNETIPANVLFSPMIDARRMEVYTALFTSGNKIFKETSAQIIKPDTFDDLLSEYMVYFFGSGAEKLSEIITDRNAVFANHFMHSSVHMASIACEKYRAGKFVDLAYFEPFYLKDFITTTSKKNFFFPTK